MEKQKQRGAVLPAVLAAVLIIGWTGLQLARHATRDSTRESEESMSLRASRLAESGLQWALVRGGGTASPVSLGGGTFEVVREGRVLTSTGRLGSSVSIRTATMTIAVLPWSRVLVGSETRLDAINLIPEPVSVSSLSIDWPGSSSLSFLELHWDGQSVELAQLAGGVIHAGDVVSLPEEVTLTLAHRSSVHLVARGDAASEPWTVHFLSGSGSLAPTRTAAP